MLLTVDAGRPPLDAAVSPPMRGSGGSHGVSLLRLDTGGELVQVPQDTRLRPGERITVRSDRLHGLLSRQPVPVRIIGPFGPEIAGVSSIQFDATATLANLGFSDWIELEVIAPRSPGQYFIVVHHPGNLFPFMGPQSHDATFRFRVAGEPTTGPGDPDPTPEAPKDSGDDGTGFLDKLLPDVSAFDKVALTTVGVLFAAVVLTSR